MRTARPDILGAEMVNEHEGGVQRRCFTGARWP
jgi:hypothetical protein